MARRISLTLLSLCACTTFGSPDTADGGATPTPTATSLADGAAPPDATAGDGATGPTTDSGPTGRDAGASLCATMPFALAHTCADFEAGALEMFTRGVASPIVPRTAGSPIVAIGTGALRIATTSSNDGWMWDIPNPATTTAGFRLSVRVLAASTTGSIDLVRITMPGQTTKALTVRVTGASVVLDNGTVVGTLQANPPYIVAVTERAVEVGNAEIPYQELAGATSFAVGIPVSAASVVSSSVTIDHVVLSR